MGDLRAGNRLIARRGKGVAHPCSSSVLALVLTLASGLEICRRSLQNQHAPANAADAGDAAPMLMLAAAIGPLLRACRVSARLIVRPIAGRRRRGVCSSCGIRSLPWGLRRRGCTSAWPALYDAAVEDPALHGLEHAHFLIGALLFWSVVIDPEPFKGTLPYAARIVYVLLAGAAQNTLLGGLLAFSTRVLYTHYIETTTRLGIEHASRDHASAARSCGFPGDAIFLLRRQARSSSGSRTRSAISGVVKRLPSEGKKAWTFVTRGGSRRGSR